MDNIKSLLTDGIEEINVFESLKKKITSGKILRIKHGVDPTRPDLHLGHAVVLWKLKEFQDLGHKIIFLIGDYTTKIGDPSGKNKTRPMLEDKEIKKNATTYFEQVSKILDIKKTEIRYNSEWFKKMNFAQIIKIAAKFTVARIIERDDFANRLKNRQDIGIHELLYPIMQAYDSVALNADVEIGGTDQKFNMLSGRELQKKMNLPIQDVITTKILVGLDGKEKMSKSLDNYIGISEKASDQFGKVMSIPDQAIIDYAILAARMQSKDLNALKKQIIADPRNAKATVAKKIVDLYHPNEGANAEADFNRQFKNKEIPFDIPEYKASKNENEVQLALFLEKTKLVSSKSEARRLILQGGVKVDKAKIGDVNEKISLRNGIVIQVGKRKFLRIIK